MMDSVFFSNDIRNALLAANEASDQTAAMVAMLGPRASLNEVHAFRLGFKAALTTVALAFGLSPSTVTGQRETLPVGSRTIEMMRNAE